MYVCTTTTNLEKSFSKLRIKLRGKMHELSSHNAAAKEEPHQHNIYFITLMEKITNKMISNSWQESFEYRHKKFDQSKRSRTDSGSSSGGDIEPVCSYIKQEIGKLEVAKTFRADAADVVNSSTKKRKHLQSSDFVSEQNDFVMLPEAKRLRLESLSPHLKLPFASPLPINATVAAAATVIPPTVAILPKLSHETIRDIYKYHGNMVRKFPKKERTPKDQERRNKNTIACRMSRRFKKLEHIAMEEQYKEFSQQALQITEKAIRATAYLHELIRLMNCSSPTAVKEEPPTSSVKSAVPPASSHKKKSFSIPFLVGIE